MPIKCKKHNWGCPYHACMTDHCQEKVVKDQGIDFGPGICEKTKPQNLTTKCISVQNDANRCSFTDTIVHKP